MDVQLSKMPGHILGTRLGLLGSMCGSAFKGIRHEYQVCLVFQINKTRLLLCLRDKRPTCNQNDYKRINIEIESYN